MRLFISIFFILSFFANISVAQKIKSSDRIQTLKNGALFVRLKTSELQIAGLKRNGKEKEAEAIRLEQEKKNASIMLAFKRRYDFSPVYFFYSNNSKSITEGNYKGLIFDSEQKKDTSFNSINYLIGEFDESKNTGIAAFIIKDKNFVALKSPFPYFIKRNVMGVNTQSDEDIVEELNKELIRFYSK